MANLQGAQMIALSHILRREGLITEVEEVRLLNLIQSQKISEKMRRAGGGERVKCE